MENTYLERAAHHAKTDVVGVIDQLIAEINDLEEEVEKLKEKVEELENKVSEYESSVKNHITIEITTSKEELENGYSHNT